jgi:hypothetical protein
MKLTLSRRTVDDATAFIIGDGVRPLLLRKEQIDYAAEILGLYFPFGAAVAINSDPLMVDVTEEQWLRLKRHAQEGKL